LAELVARYRRVCFVDAHTGDLPEEIRVAAVAPAFLTSPFTHHLTPAACLALAQTLYGRAPEAVVASARGEAFGFGRELSPAVAQRVPGLVHLILKWLGAPRSSHYAQAPTQARPAVVPPG
jgi:hydrogenase maturation protease